MRDLKLARSSSSSRKYVRSVLRSRVILNSTSPTPTQLSRKKFIGLLKILNLKWCLDKKSKEVSKQVRVRVCFKGWKGVLVSSIELDYTGLKYHTSFTLWPRLKWCLNQYHCSLQTPLFTLYVDQLHSQNGGNEPMTYQATMHCVTFSVRAKYYSYFLYALNFWQMSLLFKLNFCPFNNST